MKSNRRWSRVGVRLRGRMILPMCLAVGALLLADGQAAMVSPVSAQTLGQSMVQKATQPNQSISTKNTVQLMAEGKKVSQQGMLFENRTWVPLTFLRDELKLPLSYESVSHTYTISQDYQKLHVTLYEGGVTSYVNGYYLGDPGAKLIKGRVYIPFQWLKDYFGYEGVWNSKLKQLDVVRSKVNKLEIDTVNYSEDNSEAVISLSYPSVQLGNKAAAKAINDVLEKDTADFREYIKTSLKQRDQEVGLSPYEFNSSYVVTYNQKGLLSLFVDRYEYMGGAHGMTVRIGYTFSLEDGRLLTMKDLFGDNPDYLKVINKKLKEGFESHPGYFGGFTGLREVSDFYLQTDKIKLFFQVYEYTPYAAGIPEFSLSYEELLKQGNSYEKLIP